LLFFLDQRIIPLHYLSSIKTKSKLVSTQPTFFTHNKDNSIYENSLLSVFVKNSVFSSAFFNEIITLFQKKFVSKKYLLSLTPDY
jgi:hypothetical protein